MAAVFSILFVLATSTQTSFSSAFLPSAQTISIARVSKFRKKPVITIWEQRVHPMTTSPRHRGRTRSFSKNDSTVSDSISLSNIASVDSHGVECDSLRSSTNSSHQCSTSEKSSSEAPTSTLSDLFGNTPIESIVLLNLVAVIWGTQHAVIKLVLDDLGDGSASVFTFCRFCIGAVIAAPFTPSLLPILKPWFKPHPPTAQMHDEEANNFVSQQYETSLQEEEEAAERKFSLTAWRWGAEMGVWMFLGYAFQAIGLAYTTASKSGFLLYLNVKFVPFLAFVLLGRKISIPTWISAGTALCGTALLSYDGSLPNIGDAWSVLAALASAMFILRIEAANSAMASIGTALGASSGGENTSESGASDGAAALSSASLWVVTLLAGIWMSLGSFNDNGDGVGILLSSIVNTVKAHPFALLYLGAVTTALANYLQTRGQRDITAERASIIYAMDPVYGAGFANLILGETLGLGGLVGAGLITLAAATNAFLDLGGSAADDIDSSRRTDRKSFFWGKENKKEKE